MVSINFEKDYLFLHVPKTGGTYIQLALLKNYEFFAYNFLSFEYKKCPYSFPQSLSEYYMQPEILQSLDLTKERMMSMTKFAFVRNPYTRFISGWKFMIQSGFISGELPLEDLIDIKDSIDVLSYNHIFATQWFHMKGWTYEEIGRFEELETDFCFILKMLGFDVEHKEEKTVNKTKEYGSTFQYYTQKVLDFVNEYFDEDFSNFKYQKASSLEELETILSGGIIQKI